MEASGGVQADTEPTKIFLSYRREDSTPGTARALYQDLAARFGSDNVFLDVVTLEPGVDFLEGIRAGGTGCGVFLALIGTRWLSSLKEREQRRSVDGQQDFVRLEIERALGRESRMRVLPVAVDGAVPPGAERLPKPLMALARVQAAPLRHDRWDDDVAKLIERIEDLAGAEEEPVESPAVPPATIVNAVLPTSSTALPGDEHFAEVVRCLARGTVVPFLGSAVNSCDRDGPWAGPGSGQLPAAGELAEFISREFEFEAAASELAYVTQYVSVTRKPELFETLAEALGGQCEPTSVHTFLAQMPATLERLGLPRHCQLIVTTNYDDALERAFAAAGEPYDLVVYLTSGPDKGRFLHVPFDGEPTVIDTPNSYYELPFGEGSRVEHTTILKIHGAVDGAHGPFSLEQNYVITEDHYIEYLSQSPISQLVPAQILAKMQRSHFLFLGYTMSDWSLRVFLQRAWGGGDLPGQSWAIERAPDLLERRFWRPFNVDLFAVPLATYTRALDERLAAYAGVRMKA